MCVASFHKKGVQNITWFFALSVDPDQPAHPRSLVRVFNGRHTENEQTVELKRGAQQNPLNQRWQCPCIMQLHVLISMAFPVLWIAFTLYIR